MSAFGESVFEQSALARLERAGWQACNGATIAYAEPHVNDAQRFVSVVA